MTNNAILGTLKAQWVILKDTSASPEDRVAAYAMIDTLQKQIVKENPNASAIDLTKTRYKVFASIETAKSTPKQESAPSAPKTPYVPYSGGNTVFVPLEKYEELSTEEIKANTKKIIKICELKNLTEKIVSEKFPYYANPPSIGQILGLLVAE